MHIKRFFLNPVMVLIILCLGIGIYKIAMTACVANDSVTFMQFAEDLKTTPAQSIRSYDQHPGYSVLILVSEWLCKAMGFMGTLQERIYAVQAVTLISRTITLCFVFKIFCFYGRIKTALWGTILFVLVPAYADVGSNVLSDWPGLMWMTIALYCCLLGLRHQNLLYFLTAGAASGLGYWIRPEGAALVAVTGIYTLIYLFQEKRNKIKMCICFGIMVIAAGLITSPYMIYKGSLFPKKDIGNFRVSCESIGTPSPDAAACFQKADILAALPLKPAKAVWRFIERISNVLYLLTVPLLGIMIYKMKRYRRLPDHEQLVCLFNGLWLLLLIWLYCNHGYISQRHILPMTAFNFAWIFKGLHGTVLVLGSKRCPLHRNTAILIPFSVAVAMLTGRAGIGEYSEENIQDERISRLTRKISVIPDDQLTALFPEETAARVEIVTLDGQRHVGEVFVPKGEPANPLSDVEVDEKFLALADYAGLSSGKSGMIRDVVWGLPDGAEKLYGLL